MASLQSRHPVQTYAIGVCFTAVVMFAVSGALTAFSIVRWTFPDITSTRLIEARRLAEDTPVATCLLSEPCNGLSADEVKREKARLALAVNYAEVSERFAGRRATIIFALIVFGSAALWLGHWRLLSKAT